MGRRGPKPTPAAILQRRGSSVRRSPGRADETPALDSVLPPCPEFLAAAARREYRRAGGLLVAARVLTAADLAVLASYAQGFAEWVEALAAVRKSGLTYTTPSGFERPSPYLAIARAAREAMLRAAAELGLTPASRARVATVAKNQAESGPRARRFDAPQSDDETHYFG